VPGTAPSESDERRSDRVVQWSLRIFVAVALVTILGIFVLAKNVPQSAPSSFGHGQLDAPAVTVPAGATRSQVERACAAYYDQGLPNVEPPAQRGPFIQGCVEAKTATSGHD